MKSRFLNTVGVGKRKVFLRMWCSWSLELRLLPLNVLLAATQCPLVIASLVISSLLPAFAHLQPYVLTETSSVNVMSFRASLPGTASLAGFV